MSHSGSIARRQTSTMQGHKILFDGMTNISIPEVNTLKYCSSLAVSLPINLSIKLGFVSVNGPREIYFVDALRITKYISIIYCKIIKRFFKY